MSLFVASAALCECGTRVVLAGAVLWFDFVDILQHFFLEICFFPANGNLQLFQHFISERICDGSPSEEKISPALDSLIARLDPTRGRDPRQMQNGQGHVHLVFH